MNFNIPNDFFINKIDKTIKKILKHFPNALCDGEYDLGLGESNLSNSNGLSKSSKESGISFFISAQIINGNDMLNIYDYVSSVRNISNEEIEKITEKLLQNLNVAQNIQNISIKGLPCDFYTTWFISNYSFPSISLI